MSSNLENEKLCFICFDESTKINEVIQLHNECTLMTHMSCLKEYLKYLEQKNLYCPQCSRYILLERCNKDIHYDITKMTMYEYFKGYYILLQIFKNDHIPNDYGRFESRFEHYIFLLYNYILYVQTFVVLLLNNWGDIFYFMFYLYNSGVIYYLMYKLHQIRMNENLHDEHMRVDYRKSIEDMAGLFLIYQPFITLFLYFMFSDYISIQPIIYKVSTSWLWSSLFIIYHYMFGIPLIKRN
jgi:hypothetical protein